MPDPIATIAYPATLTGEFGPPSDLNGLLVGKIDIKPTRTKKDHNDHRDVRVVSLRTDPRMMITLDTRKLNRTGTFSNLHPGNTLSQALMTVYIAAYAHLVFGTTVVPTTAFWIVDEVSTTAERGDLDTCPITLDLFGIFPE